MRIVSRYPVVIVGIGVAIVLLAADVAAGSSLPKMLLSPAIVLAYAVAVTWLARRSETMSVLAGRPIDERWEHINLEASAWALGVSAIVILAAFVVAQLTARDWAPYAFIGAVMAASYIGSLVLVRLRH
jgi:predicted membrane protein DUF2178